jgi:predicted SnoaL-like aldol condensation-catalyzing enzyme
MKMVQYLTATAVIVLSITTSTPSLAGPVENKALVSGFIDSVFNAKQLDRIDSFLAPDYIQHNPGVPTGREGFRAAIGGFLTATPTYRFEVKRMIAEGDLVVVHGHGRAAPEDRGTAIVDIYRVVDGKLVEHWDVMQAVPKSMAHTNGMF